MKDVECINFLQWALPKLQMRWEGFRKVRKQVCKRIQRRMRTLGITDPEDYRTYIETHDSEWKVLDGSCRVTISRFYRDRHLFEVLGERVLPTLASRLETQDGRALRIWSAGCSSGEEPYSMVIMWSLVLAQRFPGLAFYILATDAERAVLRRAERACYSRGSLKDLPADWVEVSFKKQGDLFCLREAYRAGVTFREHDVRTPLDDAPFNLVLCRNLAFTYFDPNMQRKVLRQLHNILEDGGVLVIGAHEQLPDESGLFEPWMPNLGIYRRAGN